MDKKPAKTPATLGEQMSTPVTYDPNLPRGQGIPTTNPNEEVVKLKKELESLSKAILKKFKFTVSLSVLPAQSFDLFEREEGLLPEEIAKKPMHMLMVIPEDEFKNIPKKIKPDVVKLVLEHKQNVWVHIKTPVDVWNYGLDSKPEFIDAVGQSFPLHDTGFLGALRVSVIHKTLVMRKFDKYVASYVVFGSLVRGTADATSDVDVFVVIDDTDVKRMPRLQLLDRLRGMIYDYIREATALAGVKNLLNVQVWLLTDFWERVKDAEAVAFTAIRDGVPMHDRGTFLPWKLLLQMGKIRPSPEAVDKFMKSGDQTEALYKRRMLDAMVDIYYGIVTPVQALMMLAGHAPPVPKTIVKEVREALVEKEKLMSVTDLKVLEKAVTYFKDYEHGKLKSIPGKDLDIFYEEFESFNKTMKELRKKLEARMIEHGADAIHEAVFDLLKRILGAKSKEQLILDFEKELVKTGKLQKRFVSTLKNVASVKQKVKGAKLTQTQLDQIRREGAELLDGLTEYMQRRELVAVEKGVFAVMFGKDKKGELVITDEGAFFVEGVVIRKIAGTKLVDSDAQAFEKAISNTKDRTQVTVPSTVVDVLRSELGEFSISM